LSKSKRIEFESITFGGVIGAICASAADSVDFHRGIATSIGVCMAFAAYSLYYGIRSAKGDKNG
jgi:hypothetical protein